jgi:hypothetical protein
MTGKLSRCLAVLAWFVVCGCTAAGEQQQGQMPPGAVNADARVLQDFQARIDQYRELHKKAEKGPAKMKETKDPAEIQNAQDELAARIRAARADAKPGDIFTPEIRQLFRRLMYPETKGAAGRETKQAMKDDAPASVPLKVNAKYPEGVPLPTVPPNVLAALPKLPEDLEYRVVNKDLILRDVDANLIVDYIPNAIR